MNFNFNETAGASQNTAKPQLAGNMIHDVKFVGCEAKDFAGTKDPNANYSTLEIKFENESGYHTKSYFEPKDNDFEDRETQYGPNPSNVKSMMLTFKHLIDAVNPELGTKIDAGEKSLNVKSWKELRALMVQATESGKGVATQLKLVNNNKGEAIYPYAAAYNKEGKLYMKTNFIGSKLFWTKKEMETINKVSVAKPTAQSNDLNLGAPVVDSSLNFDLL